MKLYFFRRKGFMFIPVHFWGWLFLLAVLAVAVYVGLDIFSRPDPIGDKLTNLSLYIVVLILGYYFFAFFTCKPDKEDFSGNQ